MLVGDYFGSPVVKVVGDEDEVKDDAYDGRMLGAWKWGRGKGSMPMDQTPFLRPMPLSHQGEFDILALRP